MPPDPVKNQEPSRFRFFLAFNPSAVSPLVDSIDGSGRRPPARAGWGGESSSATVLAHNPLKLVEREGVGRAAIEAGHGLGGGQGFNDRLFHRLSGRVEEGADMVQGEHLDVKGFVGAGDVISGGEADRGPPWQGTGRRLPEAMLSIDRRQATP